MTPRATGITTLNASQIEASVAPMLLHPLSPAVYAQLAVYLQLLSRWNQKMNLTAVRDPELFARLHLAECLRAAQRIPEDVRTVLDFGSGSGLPGIPIQIARPEFRVTLAESQRKKAAFLQEAMRELDLESARVHAGRVENLPSDAIFDLVTLRAVDKMGEALPTALLRIRPLHDSRGGHCMVLTSRSELSAIRASSLDGTGTNRINWDAPEAIPHTGQRVILFGLRVQ
jgi:16S rRNA (guanine527-N7)-methyltransferase